MHLRIISLAETQEGFAVSVTSANNTQNDLNPIDFVAADPNQERIRKEAAQQGVTYTFRRGDKEPDRSTGFNVRTATIAAACASNDLRLAVSSKRYISGLWDNTKKEPYIRLFNEHVNANYLWMIVKILHIVDDKLSELSSSLDGREKLVSIHANRFILFCVYKTLGVIDQLKTKGLAVDVEKTSRITQECLTAINKIIAEKFPDAYPGNIFKNQDRQNELLAFLQDNTA